MNQHEPGKVLKARKKAGKTAARVTSAEQQPTGDAALNPGSAPEDFPSLSFDSYVACSRLVEKEILDVEP